MQRWGSRWPAGFSGGKQSQWQIRSLACAFLACSEVKQRVGFLLPPRLARPLDLFWPCYVGVRS